MKKYQIKEGIMSEHLTDRDAISLMLEYYGQKFEPKDTALLVEVLSKLDIIGLVQWVFEAGVQNERGRK